MATHRESRAIALAAECLFDVVADVESYPRFVPLIADANGKYPIPLPGVPTTASAAATSSIITMAKGW